MELKSRKPEKKRLEPVLNLHIKFHPSAIICRVTFLEVEKHYPPPFPLLIDLDD